MKLVKWSTALLLSVFFIFMGVQKFGDENVIFATIVSQSGIAFFEPHVRVLVGLAEMIAAGLLILPATRYLGALLGVGLLFGAVGFHLSPWLGIFVAMEPGGAPSPMLFMMALFFSAINIVVLVLEKDRVAKAFGLRRHSPART